jgi:hypothetical protein
VRLCRFSHPAGSKAISLPFLFILSPSSSLCLYIWIKKCIEAMDGWMDGWMGRYCSAQGKPFDPRVKDIPTPKGVEIIIFGIVWIGN